MMIFDPDFLEMYIHRSQTLNYQKKLIMMLYALTIVSEALFNPSHAQTKSLRDEYDNRIRSQETVKNYCENLQGTFPFYDSGKYMKVDADGSIYTLTYTEGVSDPCPVKFLAKVGQVYAENGNYGYVHVRQYLIEGGELCRYSKTYLSKTESDPVHKKCYR